MTRDRGEKEAFREYIAECARLTSENTAQICRGHYITKRWADIINPKPQDTRTAEEIKESIKAGLRRLGGE